MTVLVILALIVLGTAVNTITRAPGQKTKLTGWGLWFAFLEGLAFGAAAAVLGAAYAFLTGHWPPLWTLFAVVYLAEMGWKLYRHRQRRQEQQHLKALMEQPAFGEEKP